MNKNIKKLAEQAGLWDILDQWSYEFEDYVTEKECGEELEKFAQLIVRESVKALWTEDCHVSDLAIIDFNEKKRKIYTRLGIEE
jgi:hypothetical protein